MSFLDFLQTVLGVKTFAHNFRAASHLAKFKQTICKNIVKQN